MFAHGAMKLEGRKEERKNGVEIANCNLLFARLHQRLTDHRGHFTTGNKPRIRGEKIDKPKIS